MNTLLAFLKPYIYDSSSKQPVRSTLWVTFALTIIIILFIEIPGIVSMHELGIARGWINYRLEGTHPLVFITCYAVVFVVLRIMLLLLQSFPELFKKAKEEQERNEQLDDKDR